MRLAIPSALLFSALTACATSDDSVEVNAAVCEEAAQHMEACLPGLVATRPETCGASEADHSEWVLQQSCPDLLTAAADGKADAVPAMKGIRIKKEGNRTYFMIPLAQTFGGDRDRLFMETVNKFNAEMSVINTKLINAGIDMSGVLT